MADSWQYANLAALLSGLNSSVNSAINELNQAIDKVQATLGTINTRLDAVTSVLSAASSFLSKLTASGFYVILLQPGGPGSWSARLKGAANAPADDPVYYTAGMCVIIEAPTLTPVIDKFTQMVDIVSQPLPF